MSWRRCSSRRFAFGATIAVVDKDVMLGLAEAAALDVPMWGLEQAARVWRFAASQGAGGDDISELARVMERWAGAEIRSGTRCAVPECGGAFSRDQEDALWQQVFTAQPERRREFEPNSKRRKRRPAPSLPSTA